MKAIPTLAPPKCRLCKDNDASSIGSHIFNRELINWTLNEEGEENKTDKELAFSITPGVSVSNYFGRKTNPDKVTEVLGRDITDEELEENKTKHTYVRKYFLCVSCEGRLERIESYFMNNVYSRLKDNSFTTVELIQDLSQAVCAGVDIQLVRLYIYSLIWRAGEAKVSVFNMKYEHKEYLRNLLNDNLNTDIETTKQNAIENRGQINNLPLIISYLTTTHDPNENFIHADKSLCPYFLVIVDVSIQLFFNPVLVKLHVNYLFGMFRFQKATVIVNQGNELIKIGVISESFREEIVLKNYGRFIAGIEFKAMEQDILKAYKEFFKETPPNKLLKHITSVALLEYNDESVPIGVRYTAERRINIYLRKFAEIARQKGYTVAE